jgi:hypothetical protein
MADEVPTASWPCAPGNEAVVVVVHSGFRGDGRVAEKKAVRGLSVQRCQTLSAARRRFRAGAAEAESNLGRTEL